MAAPPSPSRSGVGVPTVSPTGRSSKPYHYIVAVDGSDISKGAFEAASAFAKRGDRITVVHVFDPAKDIPSHEMKPSAIEDYYTMRCVSRFPTGAWKVELKDKMSGETTRQTLLSYVNQKDRAGDMLLVGFVGRKGPKEDPTVLGTNADYSVRGAHMSSAVVKSKTFPEKATFVVGVDGSERSHFGVETAVHLARESDRVLIVHVTEASGGTPIAPRFETGRIEERYAQFCAAHPNTQFEVLPRDTSVAGTICSYAEDKDADVVIVGVDGLGAHAAGKGLLGSNSDAVVRKAPCTVICVQEPNFVTTVADATKK